MTVGISELPPEGMQLGGVALAGDAERGTKTTEGLSLLFTTAGITVQGPQPQIERLLVWSGLDTASCREKIALPDGRNAAVMELTSGGQSIRFLLPMDSVTPGQAAYLDQALPAWLARYKGAPAAATSPPQPTPPTASTAPAAPSGPAVGGNGSAGIPAPGPAAPAPPPPPTREPRPDAVAPAVAAAGVAAAAATSNGSGGGSNPPPPPSMPPASPTTPSTPGVDAPPPPFAVAPGSAAGSRPAAPGTPPPPPGSAVPAGATAGAVAGAAGWETATGSPGSAAAPDGSAPALAGAATAAATDLESPGKKRGWRKARPPADAPVAPPGFLAPTDPPSQPPVDPVPLRLDTPLPPPPLEGAGTPSRGPVVWKPPIDPVTGQTLWDQVEAPPETPAKKGRGWRRGAKTGAVAAAGAASAAVIADRADLDAGVGVANRTPGVSTDPEATPPPPTAPLEEPGTSAPADEPAAKSNRTLIGVLLAVLIILIGGIAYFAVKRNDNTTTTATTAATTPNISPTAADAALATSINLRLADLPVGWALGPAAGPLPPALLARQSQATRSLAACLGQPTAVVAGVFAAAPLPGQTASSRSPVFQSRADPNIQMRSTTAVLATSAAAQALTAPFASPKFLTCFTQYQSTLASVTVPGSTASVQVVNLPVPAGVRTFAYLTTFTAPDKATEVRGDAYLFGGRIASVLEPTTNGPPVPQTPFASAYDAMTARIARSAG